MRDVGQYLLDFEIVLEEFGGRRGVGRAVVVSGTFLRHLVVDI